MKPLNWLWIGLAVVLVVIGIAVDIRVGTVDVPDEFDGMPMFDDNGEPSHGAPSDSRSEMPGMRGGSQLEEAKWQEAAAYARAIGDALRTYHLRTGSFAGIPTGPVIDAQALGFSETSFRGLRSFRPADFRIAELRPDGYYVIEVTGSLPNSPAGTRRWDRDGEQRRR